MAKVSFLGIGNCLEPTKSVNEKHGRNSDEAKAALESLAAVFMMFKFTPRLFDIISEMIRGTHDPNPCNEREICVMRCVVAVWIATSSV